MEEHSVDTRALAWQSGRPPLALVIGAFFVMVVLLTAVASLSNSAADIPPVNPDLPIWVNSWFQGDSAWYQGIATIGYSYFPGQQSAIAFFPTYPMAVRGIGYLLGGHYQIAGSLIGVLCGPARR